MRTISTSRPRASFASDAGNTSRLLHFSTLESTLLKAWNLLLFIFVWSPRPLRPSFAGKFPEDSSKTAEIAQPSLQWSSSALSRFRSYCRMFRASAITPKSFISTSTDIRPLVRLFSPQIKDLESIQRRLPMPLSKASRFLQCHAAVAVNGVEGYGDLSKNNSDSRVPLTFSRLFLRWTHGS